MIKNNNQIQIVVGIEPFTKYARFDIINIRNSTNLRKFLLNHVEIATLIITDGRKGYAFLDGNESYWEHDSHIMVVIILDSVLITPHT